VTPDAQEILDNLERNRNWYYEQVDNVQQQQQQQQQQHHQHH
jgi:hypothetical protein